MTPRAISRLVPALLPLGLGLGCAAALAQHRNGRPALYVGLEQAAGFALIVSGLAVWHRRPANRCWWLLTAAGFSWSIGRLESALNGHFQAVAWAGTRVYDVFLVAALLAYPTGRLVGRASSALLVTTVGVHVVRVASRLLLYVPPDVAGYGTRNRYLPVRDQRWWTLVEDAFPYVRAGLMVAVLVLLGLRWWRSGTQGRRMMSPASASAAFMTAAWSLEDLRGWYRDVPGTSLRVTYVRFVLVGLTSAALAIGLRRVGRARSAVIDIVGDLTEPVPVARLQVALARSLGDPSLRLGTWSETRGAYVDEAGAAVEPDLTSLSRAVTLVRSGTRPLAALDHDVVLLEDPGLVNAIAATIRLATENERMRVELEARVDELARSRARIVEAGDAERRRIERDLHDGAQQRLVALGIGLRLAEVKAASGQLFEVRASLEQAVAELSSAIEELRDLARGVHPAVLTESGLGAALESLADRASLRVELTIRLEREPGPGVAAALYFTAAEALTNAAKHAGPCQVELTVTGGGEQVEMTVADNGRGGADARGGSGLRGIEDRVSAANGRVSITSNSDAGTRIEVVMPCGSPL